MMNYRFSQKELSLIKRQARERGLKKYIGNICEVHPNLLGERTLGNGTCTQCHKLKGAQRSLLWVRQNKERARANENKWRRENRERVRALERERYAKNPQARLDTHKRWRDKPEVTEYLRAKVTSYKLLHRDIYTARQTYREARKRKATLGKIPLKEFLPFYEEAARLTETTGIPHHVDHIVPLLGKTVCGLHVPWNLQVMVGADNIRKGNKFDPDKVPLYKNLPVLVSEGQ